MYGTADNYGMGRRGPKKTGTDAMDKVRKAGVLICKR